MENVDIELRDLDEEELQQINKFMLSGCSCVLGPSDINGQKTPCFNWFNKEEVVYRREQSLEMSSISPSSLEAYVLGHFSAINRTDKKIKFQISGQRVCLSTFSFLLGMSKSSIQRLYAHYSSNGFIHKDNNSKGKPSKNPWNRDIHKRREGIKIFLENLIKDHGICIPGRVPSHHDFKSIRFPSHWNREVIYQKYVQSCLEQGYLSYCCRTTFLTHWKVACPELGIMGKRSDVCSVCHVHSEELALMFRDSLQKNTIEDWTSQIKSPIKEHIHHVKTEREDYNRRVEYSRNHPKTTALLTMDFSEAKSVPHSSVQIGTSHFLSLYKVNIFAIENEGLRRSNIYIFDEAEQVFISSELLNFYDMKFVYF
ncbi:Putative LOC582807 [Caligus rogercresseyi]|uniref:LOC582807 n=1 Tax=Caligus rogercresseyi TaxID=217165 RepID=A0A7T8GYL5_CALRO|nr:Putative LOC582807 [Caligus rogercresseyi]QQP49081.1 Putative LOC582807 [Caligus rogercresseyi]